MVDISDSVPEKLFTDGKRYKQIIYNLIGNAVKFTFHGEIKMHIEYIEKPDGGWDLLTSVEDSGIGIDEEDLQKLF